MEKLRKRDRPISYTGTVYVILFSARTSGKQATGVAVFSHLVGDIEKPAKVTRLEFEVTSMR